MKIGRIQAADRGGLRQEPPADRRTRASIDIQVATADIDVLLQLPLAEKLFPRAVGCAVQIHLARRR